MLIYVGNACAALLLYYPFACLLFLSMDPFLVNYLGQDPKV